MKKLFFLNLFVLFSYILFSQSNKFYIGLNRATQNTWIFNSNDNNIGRSLEFDFTIGYAVGMDIGYQINSEFALQSGLIFSSQGQKYSTAGNTSANYRTDLYYLKLPLTLCYFIYPEKKVTIITQAGFQCSILTSAKSSRENTFGTYSSNYKDVKSSYASVPIEFVLGIGFKVNFNRIDLSFLFRSDYSLTDIEKTEKKPGLRSPASNFTWTFPQLGIHYYF